MTIQTSRSDQFQRTVVGEQPTGRIPGVAITCTGLHGLQVQVDGQPARLAIVRDDGTVVASGTVVCDEAEAAALNGYRQALIGAGRLVVRHC